MNKNKWRVSLLSCALSASVLLCSAPVFAASQRMIKVNAPLVNIRIGNSTEDSKLGVGRRGSTYEYLSSKIDEEGITWYEIQFMPDRTGWVSSQYAQLLTSSATTTTTTAAKADETDDAAAADTKYVSVTYGTAYLREDAGASSPVVARLSYGHTYLSTEEKQDGKGETWYKVRYSNEVEGWISADTCKVTDREKAGGKSAEQITIENIAQRYGAVGVQVALTENGRVTDTYNCGYATQGAKPMSTNNKIRAASISQLAVGMAAVKMQEEGLVDLDKDIGEYWGVTLYHPTTLRELLTHTSYLQQNYYKNTEKETLEQLQSAASFRASNDWLYNNYAMGIAGATLEKASGETLNEYMDRKFFTPLGIDAAFTSGDIQDVSLLATLYYGADAQAEDGAEFDGQEGDGAEAGAVALSTAQAKAIHAGEPGSKTSPFANGLTISARDMAKLVAVVANDGVYWGKRYLSANSVKLLETQFCDGDVRGRAFKQCIPLRYQTDLYGQEEMYYQLGTAYGTLSYVSYNPKTKKGIVIITTGADAGYDDKGIWNICGGIAQYFFNG